MHVHQKHQKTLVMLPEEIQRNNPNAGVMQMRLFS